MNALVELLAERSLAIVLATTAVLAVAALAVAASRTPLHRERSSELGIVCAALAFVLMLLPLPGPVGQLSRSLEIASWGESALQHGDSSFGTKTPLIDSLAQPQGLEQQPEGIPGMAPKELAATTPSQVGKPSLAFEPTPMLGTRMAETQAEKLREFRTLPRAGATVFAWGTLAMLAYVAFSAFVLARLARRAMPIPAWLSEVLPARGDTQLLLCGRSSRPFCFGMRRARVVLPALLVQHSNTALLRCVVQHELAHVRLGHLRWRQAIAACSLLLFAHPLYWWLARSQREAAELLADDQAANRVGKGHYVEQLISLVEQLRFASTGTPLSAPLPLLVLGAPQGADGPFYQRMRTLLMRTTTLRTHLTRLQLITRGLTCAVLLASITVALGRAVEAQETPLSAVGNTALHEESISEHVAKPGDTLVKIANKYFGTAGRAEDIAMINGVNDQQPLCVGQSLTVCTPGKAVSISHYIVKPGDSLAMIALKYLGTASKAQVIATLNGIDDQHPIYVGQSLTISAAQDSIGHKSEDGDRGCCGTIPQSDGPRGQRCSRGTPDRCDQCHVDAHREYFRLEKLTWGISKSGSCATCHSTESIHEVDGDRLDHGYWAPGKLQGQHQQSACDSCHMPDLKPGANGRRFGRRTEHFGRAKGCATCHADLHGGRFDGHGMPSEVDGRRDCLRCHSRTSFRSLPFGFDHERWTGFALTGKHASTSCSSCHAPTPAPQTSALGGRGWRPTNSASCRDCHADPHPGQISAAGRSDCAKCHKTSSSFSDLNFEHNLDGQTTKTGPVVIGVRSVE